MKVLRVLFILSACILEWANSCNAFYDGHGLFGDNYMNGRPHVHVHQGHGHYNQQGHGYNGFGGLMDTMFRTDIGGMGSHGYHHHQHRHSPLIPMSHSPHRHVHRVYRRSAYFRRSPT